MDYERNTVLDVNNKPIDVGDLVRIVSRNILGLCTIGTVSKIESGIYVEFDSKIHLWEYVPSKSREQLVPKTNLFLAAKPDKKQRLGKIFSNISVFGKETFYYSAEIVVKANTFRNTDFDPGNRVAVLENLYSGEYLAAQKGYAGIINSPIHNDTCLVKWEHNNLSWTMPVNLLIKFESQNPHASIKP